MFYIESKFKVLERQNVIDSILNTYDKRRFHISEILP